MPDPVKKPRRKPLTRCPVCGDAHVPPGKEHRGKVCSGACGFRASIGQVIKEGRVPIEDRPKPGEKWTYMGWEVWITTVDSYGRWFDYVRFDNAGLHWGSIGQTALMGFPSGFPVRKLEG